MSNHLVKWEEVSGSPHHCAICGKPLNHPTAVNSCLGIHETVCVKFHVGFLRVGRSRDCRPCKTSAEQDFKRHREIAELVLRLESFVAGNGHFSKGRDTSGYTNTTWFKSSAFGINGNANLIRDNKASIIVESVGSTAAKMLSLSNTQVTVKASDVERIKSLLYPYSSLPSTYDAMDDKLRIKCVTDGPIHRLRQRQDIMGDKQEPDYETITAKVLNDLHVPSLTEDGSRETKAIAKKLKMAIVEVLKVDFRQADETRKRQIGFAYFLTSGALARIQDCVAGWDPVTGAKLLPSPAKPSEPTEPSDNSLRPADMQHTAVEAAEHGFSPKLYLDGGKVVDKRGQGLLARRRFHPTTTKNELPLQPLKTVRIINVPANKTAGNSGHSKENVRYPSPSRNPWQVDYTQTGRVSFDHVSLTDTGSTLSRRSSVSLFSNCFSLPPPDSSTEKQRTESFALKSSVVPSWSRVSRHKITENAKTTLFNSPVVKNGTRTIPASISPFKKVTKRTPSHALFRGSSKVDKKKPKWSRMECPDSEIPDMDADSGIDELSFLLKKLR